MSCSCMPGTTLWQMAGSMWSTSWTTPVPSTRRYIPVHMDSNVIVFALCCCGLHAVHVAPVHGVLCSCELTPNICRHCIS